MLHEEFSLKSYNTFGVQAWSLYFYACKSETDLMEFLQMQPDKEMPIFVLGGGSNILFIGNFLGLIIHPQIMGISALRETDDDIYIRAGAGVEWDDLVAWCVDKGYGGLENLSHIPGCVGASPVQNIGAYGVEVQNSVYQVEMVDLQSGEKEVMLAQNCEFGYRNSIFKNELKGQKVITYVTFKLTKKPNLVLDYGALRDEVESLGELTLANVRKSVIKIRESKLPDHHELGNAGSFFKNPVVDITTFQAIKDNYPDIPSFVISDKEVKIPAAWLIDTCEWKGKTMGQAGVHQNQPLVLVNLGKASGGEILALGKAIVLSVEEQFKITLEMEVNLVGKPCH